MGRHRILLLGGTTEARQLAERLAGHPAYEATLSLAGRTAEPRALPLAVRSGGFGGAEGLAAYLRAEQIDLLIDATHPFANRISANAAWAAKETGVQIFALRRPGWERVEGDVWESVDSVDAAVDALGTAPRRVFLAIGRQEAFAFSRAPQHAYVVRSVDPVVPPLDVPQAEYILATGPFDEAGERRLLEDRRIDVIVAKNSGGSATYGKIAAARILGKVVVMIERQVAPDVPSVADAEAALERITHVLPPA
ncbi:cobalt-precorrin-6A reductase [Rhizobium sp. LjRoot30]|uniref:cobalt-precorrin-6A reductase n=1 Tax=Rhizobium sp. LjRoot30 TaxID=3342320 RepID=UPI003ECCE543